MSEAEIRELAQSQPVVMFSSSYCGYCAQAQEALHMAQVEVRGRFDFLCRNSERTFSAGAGLGAASEQWLTAVSPCLSFVSLTVPALA